MHGRLVLTFASLVWLTSAAVWAAGDVAVPGKRGPRTEEFERIHGEMNTLLAELAQLQIRYRTADDEKRAEIQQQWKVQIAQGEKLGAKFVAAAEKAYAEAPNADPKITNFLAQQLTLTAQRDDFEPAFEIGKLLMQNGCHVKQVAALAGVAALAESDFDDAEQYFRQAAANGESLSFGRDREYLNGLVKGFCTNPQYSQYLKQSWAREQSIRQREIETNNLPRVLLKTTKGDIVVELFENEAPNTVANFISLVERGFYKDTSFHRVVAGYYAQGGDPRGNDTGGPGYSIPCECYPPNHPRDHFRGSLTMAHGGRDTGGSQFYITFVPTAPWNGQHTVFGRVISGLDVLAKLERRDPGDAEAPRADKIIEAKVLRKRSHKYLPVKMPE